LTLLSHLIVDDSSGVEFDKERYSSALKLLEGAGLARDGRASADAVAAVLAHCRDEVRDLDNANQAPAGAPQIRGLGVKNRRIVTIPSNPAARRELFGWILSDVLVALPYSEREITIILSAIHDDPALLRRCLVDEGYLDRDPGRGLYYLPQG